MSLSPRCCLRFVLVPAAHEHLPDIFSSTGWDVESCLTAALGEYAGFLVTTVQTQGLDVLVSWVLWTVC